MTAKHTGVKLGIFLTITSLITALLFVVVGDLDGEVADFEHEFCLKTSVRS